MSLSFGAIQIYPPDILANPRLHIGQSIAGRTDDRGGGIVSNLHFFHVFSSANCELPQIPSSHGIVRRKIVGENDARTVVSPTRTADSLKSTKQPCALFPPKGLVSSQKSNRHLGYRYRRAGFASGRTLVR